MPLFWVKLCLSLKICILQTGLKTGRLFIRFCVRQLGFQFFFWFWTWWKKGLSECSKGRRLARAFPLSAAEVHAECCLWGSSLLSHCSRSSHSGRSGEPSASASCIAYFSQAAQSCF